MLVWSRTHVVSDNGIHIFVKRLSFDMWVLIIHWNVRTFHSVTQSINSSHFVNYYFPTHINVIINNKFFLFKINRQNLINFNMTLYSHCICFTLC